MWEFIVFEIRKKRGERLLAKSVVFSKSVF